MRIVPAVQRVVWDLEKELDNIRGHGVDFTEAATVLVDPLVWREPDPDHSISEDRYRAIGFSAKGRLLVVVAMDIDLDTVRIISAWRATKRERHDHEAR